MGGMSDPSGPLQPFAAQPNYLETMADGTVKQINPFSGTEVWTVPGRSRRPLGLTSADPKPLQKGDFTSACAFCSDNYLQTPPEKSRLVRTQGSWEQLDNLKAPALFDTLAEFRRIPNLFEIVSLDFWQQNYGYQIPVAADQRMQAYMDCPAGRAHLEALVAMRIQAPVHLLSQDAHTDHVEDFFAGGHDVIVARRHYVDGAINDSQLASSGTLSPAEHIRYFQLTVDALRDLYAQNRYVRYVAVFQNWLKPAGASFDHLHKQLVAIDERGVQAELELLRSRVNPNCYNELGVNYAAYRNLIIAENDHAIAFAGFGHRFPAVEVYSKAARCAPWDHRAAEIAAVSDLVHAIHAASGPDIPCNEEWHHRPPDQDVPAPWRIVVKWRVSTLAGFEGGTKVYLNTIDPVTLRDRLVPALFDLRAAGRIEPSIRIAAECECTPNPLRYQQDGLPTRV